MKFFVNNILLPACAVYTILSFGFSALLSWSGSQLYVPFMDISSTTQILVYAFVVAACGSLFTVLPYFGALAIDFVGVVGGAGVIFLLIGKHYSTSEGAWGLVFVLAIVYAVVAAIVSVIRYFAKKPKVKIKSN